MQFYNNLVYKNLGAAGGVSVSFATPLNTQVYNNAIYGNAGDGLHIDASAKNTVAKNNILMNDPVPIFNGSGSTTLEKNLCSSSNPSCDLVDDPLFENADAGIFTLKTGSPARNKGTPLTTFNVDRIGVARQHGPAWDIGPYAYIEGGGMPPTGKPIYVAKTGSPSNNCTDAENPTTPKLTIGDALSCMTVPGKTLYIKAGTYTETIDTRSQPLTGGNGPSYTDATVIEAYGTDVVTLRPTGDWVLFLRNPLDHYVIFRKLILDGNATAANVIALYPGVHHIRFEQVEVKNVTTGGFEAVYAAGANNIEWIDSHIHHGTMAGIGIDGPASNWLLQRTTLANNGGPGLRHKSSSFSNTVIRESLFYTNSGGGIQISSGTGFFLTNSVVYTNTGIGVWVKSGAAGSKIHNTTVFSNTGNGVQCDVGATGAEIKNVVAFSNGSGGTGDIINNCGATVATNVTTDPVLVSPPGNVQFADGSAGMNTGTPRAGVDID